jgi:type IX secretion system PorP/SprF family membrane protein
MKQKFLTLSLFVLVVAGAAVAQQDKLITHFMYDKMSLNPGKTGMDKDNMICATTIYRNQWDKVNGAPNSALLNVEANLAQISPWLSGIGISFFHDAIAFTRQNNLMLNYSYHLPIGNAGNLGIGIGIGMVNLGMNPEWVPPTTLNDASLPTAFSSTNLDLNFGLYWKGAQDYYVGISSTHLSESSLLNDENVLNETTYNTARHYYVMGGKTFRGLGTPKGDLEANVLMRTDIVKFSADINVRYLWNQMLYGGLTYRTSDAVAIMVGYNPIRNLTVGYSYDITVNKLSSVSRGSHEILLKYCYHLPPIPIQTTKHPRWL